MQTTILVSRFRDSRTPGALPLVEEYDWTPPAALQRGPDLVSIHSHALERGRFLVIEWTWDPAIQDWQQTGVVNAPSLENAREYVPPRAELRAVPPEFGLEAWVLS